MRLLVKEPVPVPSVVLLLAVVGLGETDQHTPRAVMAAPPPAGMFPPLVAVVWVIPETVAVDTKGRVVKVSWLP